MNFTVRFAQLLRYLKEHTIVWCVLCASCITYFIVQRHGLQVIAVLFVPDTLQELLQELAFSRLWTPVLVHYTLVHLLTNLYLWWSFATPIETESRRDLLLLVLVAGAVSNAAQWSMAGANFGGLSGLVYALLSYRWLVARYGGKENYRIDPALVIVMLAALPLAASGILGKFADFAHIGGLVSGAALAATHIMARKASK
jgi:GlpG protein